MNKADIETIINYNRADDMASVFTYDQSLQNYMERRLHVKVYQDYGRHGKEYLVPKKWIPKPRPPRKRILTDEQRAEISERFKKVRAKRLKGNK